MDSLENLLERLVEELLQLPEVSTMLKIQPMSKRYYHAHKTEILWELLWYNGYYDIIEKLAKAEKDSLFSTIVVPKGGFTTDEVINAIILDYCKSKHFRVVDVYAEIQRLKDALHHTNTIIGLGVTIR